MSYLGANTHTNSSNFQSNFPFDTVRGYQPSIVSSLRKKYCPRPRRVLNNPFQSNRDTSAVQISFVAHPNDHRIASPETLTQNESTWPDTVEQTAENNLTASDFAQDPTQAVNPPNNLDLLPPAQIVADLTNDEGTSEQPTELAVANAAFELRPHPCTFPLSETVAARGITAIICTFLVDILPANYHYLPFRYSTSSSPFPKKWQIPFFCFSGPDPPPADIGSLGDIYISPEASALYACLPVEGEAACGTWTRWSAVQCDKVKINDPGIIVHPYFPAQMLWPVRASFGWYSMSTIATARRSTRSLVENEDAEVATKILVAHTLQLRENMAKMTPKMTPKRKAAEGPGREEPRKKARARQLSRNSSTSREPSEGLGAVRQDENDWNAYYGKPRNNTRITKEMREQAATIVRLEAKNAALKESHEAQAASLERLEVVNAVLKTTIDKGFAGQQKPRAVPERMAFHPEFLDFMRETFAHEAMRTCNAQRVAAEIAASDARVEIAVLKSKLAHLNNIEAPPSGESGTNGQIEVAHACGGLRHVLQAATTHDDASARAPNVTTSGLEDRVKKLETENENLRSDAMRDAASLRQAESKIAALEADILNLTLITKQEADALWKFLAARECPG
ncbi:hypothetical protein C8R45DRAFT_1012225 [Mycena sanguinolenta]|nr:hypothetical protein C8R45DRAFT_1012225 [Mycena sanguinolenta]